MTARAFSLRFSMAYALMMVGMGVQLPFLPLWLSAKGIDVVGIAFIVAGMMAVRVVGSPLFAWAADHFGNRRRVIRVCAFSAFVAFVALIAMDGFWPIAITALLAAFLFAPVFPLSEGFSIEASAALGVSYGRMRLWASLGFLAGSLISGAVLTRLDALDTVWLLAIAQGLAVVSAMLLPDEPDGIRKSADVPAPASATAFLFASSFPLFIIIAGLGQASHGMLYSFSAVHWTDLGFDPFTIGALWTVGILAEVCLFAYSTVVVERLGPGLILLIGLAGCVIRWTGMAFASALWTVALLQALHAVTFAMTHLGTLHMMRLMVPDRFRNRAQGLYAAVSGGVLLAASAWISGPLYGAYGAHAYLFMAAVSAVALGLGMALLRFNSTVRAAAAA